MISIDGITLSNDLLWENEFDNPSIAMREVRTVGGRKLIQTGPVQGGRIIELSAVSQGNSFSGYFTRDQVQQLKSIEQAGNAVVFIHESTTLNVVIQSGGVNVRPIIPRPDQDTLDWYTGTITLVEVGG